MDLIQSNSFQNIHLLCVLQANRIVFWVNKGVINLSKEGKEGRREGKGERRKKARWLSDLLCCSLYTLLLLILTTVSPSLSPLILLKKQKQLLFV
jgi:hypothetical protein